MPCYEYRCDDCKITEEHIHPFSELDAAIHKCPHCDKLMRRLITGGSGVIFKGTGWPSKAIKLQNEDGRIQKARRKAARLKQSGAVPWKEKITVDGADNLYSKMETEMRKKEEEKIQSGTVDKEMDAKVGPVSSS